MSQKNKIDVDKIDLDKMAEKVTQNPGTITHSHSIGGVVIRPEDKGKIKGRSLMAMKEHTDRQMEQLYEQMEVLAAQARALKKRVEISEIIYQATISFEPFVGHTYYLYERKEDSGDFVLSMIHPNEWGKKKAFERFISAVTLLPDHTWKVDEDVT